MDIAIRTPDMISLTWLTDLYGPDILYLIDRKMDMISFTWLTKMYGLTWCTWLTDLIGMTNRNVWTWLDSHDWHGRIDMTWLLDWHRHMDWIWLIDWHRHMDGIWLIDWHRHMDWIWLTWFDREIWTFGQDRIYRTNRDITDMT